MLIFIKFIIFTALAVVGPGITLQLAVGVRPDPVLVVPLGAAFIAGAYWLSLVAELPVLFPALVFLALLVPAWRRAPALSWPGPFAAAGVALVALLALTQYPWNRRAADDRFLLDPFVAADTAFHVGLTRELTLGFPPQVPGIAGFPLGYHLGTDLVRAAALRWAGIDPFDGIARLDVTLWALALALLLGRATVMLGAPRLAVVLAPWTLLATDFSWVFAAHPQAHWWADLLRGNVLISVALANPVIPGLGLALGALVALWRYESGEGRGFLLLALAQAAALPFFKVFLGAHLIVGLAAAAVLRRQAAPAFAALAAAVPTAILASGTASRSLEVAWAPLDLVAVSRESLGLPSLDGWSLAAWSTFWIAASLGMRVLGLPEAFRALLRGPNAAVTGLAVMALAAWPGGLLFRISAPDAVAGQRPVNDAAYLLEQGGPLLWLFTIAALARGAARLRRPGWLLIPAACLSLPSTVHFVVKKATLPPDPIPAAMVRAMDVLAAESQPGDVVLQRPGARYPALPVILIGRRVPYERFTPYLTQFAPRAELERRHARVHRFFRTTETSEARDIASELGARFVCVYGADRLRFPPEGFLEVLYEEPAARVYRTR